MDRVEVGGLSVAYPDDGPPEGRPVALPPPASADAILTVRAG